MARLWLLFLGLAVNDFNAAVADEIESDRALAQISRFNPMYVLMGNSFTKIELSFKARLTNPLPIYFGYSQLMLWQLFVESPYFYELNYSPELLYRVALGSTGDSWLDLSPLLHQSNGRGGGTERSWNRSYAKYHGPIPFLSDPNFLLDAALFAPWGLNNNNLDIVNYLGWWEIDLTWKNIFSHAFDVSDLFYRWLGRAQELNFRLRLKGHVALPLFLAQVYQGYGESLIDYNVSNWGIRAGIEF